MSNLSQAVARPAYWSDARKEEREEVKSVSLHIQRLAESDAPLKKKTLCAMRYYG